MDYIPYFIHEDIYLIKEENRMASLPDVQEVKQEDLPGEVTHIAFPYEGKNLKKILVLTSNENADFLADREKMFLGKILGALRFNFDDIAIVNTAKVRDGLAAKISQFDCRYVLSFGVVNDQLPINNKTGFYEVSKQGEVTFLLVDALLAIEGDEGKKRRLWNILKQLFSL